MQVQPSATSAPQHEVAMPTHSLLASCNHPVPFPPAHQTPPPSQPTHGCMPASLRVSPHTPWVLPSPLTITPLVCTPPHTHTNTTILLIPPPQGNPSTLGITLAEPLGGGLFTSNVVLGAVVLLSSRSQSVVLRPAPFLKDLLFYLAALGAVLMFMRDGKVGPS